MIIYITLCIAAVSSATPLHARSASSLPPSVEGGRAPRHHQNLAELLIPLLERNLDNKHEAGRTHRDKKVIQVLPYEDSEEHAKYGWKKLKTNKKQLVEITPLRRKGDNGGKPLAYILSATNPVDDNDDTELSASSSAEDSVVDSGEYHDEHDDSTDDVVWKIIPSEDEKASRTEFSRENPSKISSDTEDEINYDNVSDDLDSTINARDENISQKVSDKIQSTEKLEEDKENKSVGENESDNESMEESSEMGASLNSGDLLFGPGNNIIFERDSSESVLKDTDEVSIEDIDNSENPHTAEDQNSNFIESEEIMPEDTHKSDEIPPKLETIVKDYSDEGLEENSLKDSDAVDSDVTHDLNYEEHNIDNLSRKEKNYRFRNEDLDQRMDSKEIAKVNVPFNEKKESQLNCERIKDKGKRVRHNHEHKSYRLSFLFNR